MLLLAARQEAYPYPPLAECPGRYWKKHFPVQVCTERRTSLAQDFSWLCVCWALYFPLLLFSSIFQVWVLINNVYFNSFQDPTYSLHIQPYWVRLENTLLRTDARHSPWESRYVQRDHMKVQYKTLTLYLNVMLLGDSACIIYKYSTWSSH